MNEIQNQCVDALLHHWDKNPTGQKASAGKHFHGTDRSEDPITQTEYGRRKYDF